MSGATLGCFGSAGRRLRHGRIPWQCGQRRWRDHWHPGQRGCLLRHRWQRRRGLLTAAQRRPNEWRDTGQLRNSWERLRHGRIPWQCGQCWSSGSACKWSDPWNSRHDWRLLRHGGQRWRSFLTAAQRRPNEWRDTGLFRKCRERLRHGRIPWQCGQRRWRDHWHPGQRGCLLRTVGSAGGASSQQLSGGPMSGATLGSFGTAGSVCGTGGSLGSAGSAGAAGQPASGS